MSFSRDLLSGNRLPEGVIDYQWPKWFITAIRNLNSNFTLCNRLHMVIDYQQLLNVLIQILNPVIDYTSLVIDYQRGFSENYFQGSHLFKWILHDHQRSIYMWLGTRICLEFFRTKRSYPLKKQNHLILLKIPWPIHLQFNKEFLSAQLFNLSLSREISSSLHLISKKGLRDRWSLVVKQSEDKGRVVLVWFRTCKGLLQDSGTLKRVAWWQDVGTRVWPN